MSQAYLRPMSGMSLAYLKHVSVNISSHILGISQTYLWHIWCISQAYLRVILGKSPTYLRRISSMIQAHLKLISGKIAMAHHLQCCTAFSIQNGHKGNPKWPMSSGKRVSPLLFDPPIKLYKIPLKLPLNTFELLSDTLEYLLNLA